MKALIDGDILIYRVGFTTEELPVQLACSRMDETIRTIVEGSNADEFSVFLTGTGHKCFRYTLYPEYKANRKQPKPLWYDELRAHLVADYGASVEVDLEADDALGIAQDYNTCICSIDKDLDQVPGEHYDFVKKISYTVTVARAVRYFYYQLLMGDTTDNIKGIPGCGPKTAEKILRGLTTEKEYLKASLNAYKEAKLDRDYMALQGRLVKIKQILGEPLWVPEEGVELKIIGEVDSKLLLKSASNETELSTSTSLST